eukprot:7391278-Prymnesium_polylepis.1
MEKSDAFGGLGYSVGEQSVIRAVLPAARDIEDGSKTPQSNAARPPEQATPDVCTRVAGLRYALLDLQSLDESRLSTSGFQREYPGRSRIVQRGVGSSDATATDGSRLSTACPQKFGRYNTSPACCVHSSSIRP